MGMSAKKILIIGGGYVGMYTARHLRRMLRAGEAEITVVDPKDYMTYQPFLAEAAGGAIEPRHVVAPLHRVLKGVRVLTGRVTGLDHDARTAVFEPARGPARTLGYDILVMATGSITRTLPLPGLAEHGMGFKTLGEAVQLRDHVLAQLDVAASTDDDAVRRAALAFVVVGGGFAGVEALAELQAMAEDAAKEHGLDPAELRWILVEATGGILPELDGRLGAWTVRTLTGRGVEVRLGTTLDSAVDGHVALSDGTELDAGTLVWAAGGRPNPLAAASGLPVDRLGRIETTEFLNVRDIRHAFAAGDGAAVPDLTRPGQFTAPNAQHAMRQAKVLARNVVADVRGEPLRPYRHAYLGSVAGLGHRQGVAQIHRVRLTGLLGWLAHRGYHLLVVPTMGQRVRVLAGWLLSGLFHRENVRLDAR